MNRPMGVRVSGSGQHPREPETFEEALADVHRRYCTADAHDPVCSLLHMCETDVRTEWALDCREPVGIFSSIVVATDKEQAQRLSLEYQRPVLRRYVYNIRRFGDWVTAE